MSLANYTDLASEITAITGRTDIATARLPNWVTLVEAELNTVLRRREMTQLATASTVANQQGYALPTDFMEAVALHLNSVPLQILDPSDWDQIVELHSNYTARPQRWSLTDNQFLLGPTPDAVYALELYYYRFLPALTATAPTNWLMTSYPHIYLYGALFNGANSFMAGDGRGAFWEKLFREGVQRLVNDQIRTRPPALLRADLPFGGGSRANILTGV